MAHPVKPSFEIINVSDRDVEFIARDCHLEVMNSLRRVILSEVETVAAQYDQYNMGDSGKNDIFIIENTTVLHDQIMGHRISLLPVHMTYDKIKNHARDDYKFVLNTKNETNAPIYVTSGDVVIYDKDASPLNQQQRDALLPPDYITGDYPIIARLKPGEVFKAEFYARRGVAIDHARFSPVSTCAYMNVVDSSAAEADIVASLEGQDDDKMKEIREQHETLKKYRIFKKDSLGDARETRFLIESECGMSACDIVLAAFDVIIEKINRMDSPDKLRVVKVTELNNDSKDVLYELELLDEDHTMGNLYQALCYRFYEDIEYIGYNVPHPLERKVKFKIKMDAKKDLDSFVVKSRKDILAHVEQLRYLFAEATKTS